MRKKFEEPVSHAILEKEGLSDQACTVIEYERQIFLHYFKDTYFSGCEIERVGNIIVIKKDDETIRLGGDNLGTRKMMAKKYKMGGTENDSHIYSYILMPIKSRLNSRRAAVSGYHDNPFKFLRVLKKLYDVNFEKDNPDKVESAIIDNKEFWKLFVDEEERPSFERYLECFCLWQSFELVEQREENSWDSYNHQLDKFLKKRKDEMKERIKQIEKSFD